MEPVEMIDHLRKGGFKDASQLIHVLLGGSHQHGAAIPGKVSDLDFYGVYVEPPQKILGVTSETHFTGGTQDQYERNRPGDEDYKCYTLQRWAGLACKGNPTIMGFLFTDCALPGVWRDFVQPHAHLFKARNHAKAFLGYAQGQVSRLNGSKGKGKHGQRPELEEAFGYDTKAAMHLMRLMFEAEEYMQTGKITYPRPEKDLLLQIRQGGWSEQKLMLEYAEAEKRVKKAMEKSTLPDQVDRDKISTLIAHCYLKHWWQMGYLVRVDPNILVDLDL